MLRPLLRCSSAKMSKIDPEVVKHLMVMAELFNREFTPGAARILAQDLSEYPAESVLHALSRCRKELRFFPTLADIIARVPGAAPDEATQATLIASRISEAVTKFGPYRAKEARAYVGKIGWQIILETGGLYSICEMGTRDLAMNRAHWAKIAEAKLKSPAPLLSLEEPEHEAPKKLPFNLKLPEMPKEKK